jgi:hypothetical protein
MRVQIAAVLVVAGLSACKGASEPTPVISPEPEVSPAPQDTTVHLSAALLRRLAEAADGYRDSADHFVVVSLEAPHAVAEVVGNRKSADSIATERSKDGPLHYGVFGPFRTDPDSLARASSVDSVVAFLSDGKQKRYLGNEVDALFWSLPAYDKFVAPYEAAVYGVLEAARRRELYRRDQHPGTNSKPLPHYRNSF